MMGTNSVTKDGSRHSPKKVMTSNHHWAKPPAAALLGAPNKELSNHTRRPPAKPNAIPQKAAISDVLRQ